MTVFLQKYFNAMKMAGMGVSLAFVLTASHHTKLFYLILPSSQGSHCQCNGNGLVWRLSWLRPCLFKRLENLIPQTEASLSTCTCCPETTMLRVSSQREQETVPKIAFPFPHHSNSCCSLQNMFSRQWTAFYSAFKTREVGTETGLTFEPRSLKIISTSRILPNCCRETRERKKKHLFLVVHFSYLLQGLA